MSSSLSRCSQAKMLKTITAAINIDTVVICWQPPLPALKLPSTAAIFTSASKEDAAACARAVARCDKNEIKLWVMQKLNPNSSLWIFCYNFARAETYVVIFADSMSRLKI
jgi:hypothetical protein